MILLDPDLDPPPASSAKKAVSSPESRKAELDQRLPSVRTLSRFLQRAHAAVRLEGLVSVLLTTDKKIQTLNRDFRRKNKATDVLSFPAAEISRGEVAGDLAISVDTARRQSGEQGHALATEIKVLILHGLLHLAGYDHETDNGRMARRERVLRAKLALPLGLIERSTPKAGPKAGPDRPASSARSMGRTAAGARTTAGARSAVGPTAGGPPSLRESARIAPGQVRGRGRRMLAGESAPISPKAHRAGPNRPTSSTRSKGRTAAGARTTAGARSAVGPTAGGR